MSRIRSGGAVTDCISAALRRKWELDDVEPVFAEAAHDLDEPRERHGLRDERVGAEVVAPGDVLVGFRRGQDDDRDAAKLRIGLDLAKGLASVLSWHVQV